MSLEGNWLQVRVKGKDSLMGLVGNLDGKRVEREGVEEGDSRRQLTPSFQ